MGKAQILKKVLCLFQFYHFIFGYQLHEMCINITKTGEI